MRTLIGILPFFTAACVHETPAPVQPADTPIAEAQPADTGWSSGAVQLPDSQLDVQLAGQTGARIGCPVDATVTLTNPGVVPVEIRGLSTEGAGWRVEPLHTELAPGDSIEVTLHRMGTYTADTAPGLRVDSDAQHQTGNAQTWTTSAHTATPATFESEAPRFGALDVVVASSPYGLEEDYPDHPLYDGLPALADQLSAAGIDWQMTVVSHSSGCPSAAWPIITPETVGWDSDEELASSMVGPTKCSVYGQELMVSARTFAQLEPGACAELTHRVGTPVSLVLMRFGNDRQPESEWERLLSAIRSRVGAPVVQVDEVVHTVDMDAVDWLEAMGGQRYDMDHWVPALPAFVDQLPIVQHYSLPIDAADAEAVEVTVDGEPNHTWRLEDGQLSWDAADHPVPGARIEVLYTDASECP